MVGSNLRTLSLRRFHRNAAAAACSLLSQEAVSLNSINSDAIAPKRDINQYLLASVRGVQTTRAGDLCDVRRISTPKTPQ